MTTVSRPPRTGWWRFFLAAIAALLIGLLDAGTASATTPPEVETRVGASTPVTAHVVGVHESITAGQRWAKAPPTAQIVSATGVAAKAEAGAVEACAGGKCVLPGTCFVAGTLIRTERGDVPIEEVKVGDKVWSRNTTTGKDELQPVVETYIRHTDTLLKLTVAGAVLTTTADHPFMVKDRGWVKAGDLTTGDVLVTPTGTAALAGVERVAKGATVYNFQVAVNHDYYALAGAVPVLVHNANYWPTPTAGNCTQCAAAIQKMIGGERAVITPRGAPKLGPSTRDPGGDWFYHEVVVKDGRVYDGFTGPGGMSIPDFKGQFQYPGEINFGF